MAQARRSGQSGIWANALAAAFEFFPEEGLVLLAGAAAGFGLLVMAWALRLLLEDLKWI